MQLKPEDIARIDLTGAGEAVARLRKLVSEAAFTDPHDAEAWQLKFNAMAECMSAIADKLRMTSEGTDTEWFNPNGLPEGTKFLAIRKGGRLRAVILPDVVDTRTVQLLQDAVNGARRAEAEALAARPPLERVKFWGGPYDDELRHGCMGDFLDAFVEENWMELPETTVAVGYATRPIDDDKIASLADYIIEDLIERLDQDHGNPEDPYRKRSPEQERLARQFVADVVATYDVWACEEVYRETVDIRKWIESNIKEGDELPTFAGDKR